jgi:hypothetical protein
MTRRAPNHCALLGGTAHGQRISSVANQLLTINMITREAVRLWKNSNAFIQNIDMQYDDSFAQTGAKIGTALRIRLPNDFTVRTGAAASVQDTSEQSTTMVLATQMGVDLSFSSVDRTMSLDDFAKRILAPAVNNLAGGVATTIMQGTEGGVANFVANVDAGNNILSPNAQTFLNANANLNRNSAPLGNRKVVNTPDTEAKIVGALAGLFNPQPELSRQYRTGTMQQALGFDWFMDQTAIAHTTGTYTGAATVSGAGQTGTSVVSSATAGTLNQGDFITLAGVNQVNRITKTTTGVLRQFTVTAPVPAGSTSIPIYPAIIPAVGGVAQQYQTVTVSPANGAAILLVTNASSVYRKNIAYAPEAVTMATADLELPGGVHEAHREAFDGIAMRMVTAYNITTDQFITRLDVLFGFLFPRPEWAVCVADSIP